MESEVTITFYIGLDMVDGSVLYFNSEPHQKNWSAFRRQGTAWTYPKGAENALREQLDRKNVPSNARVIKLKTTVEEIE
jgi:hypothetical protein